MNKTAERPDSSERGERGDRGGRGGRGDEMGTAKRGKRKPPAAVMVPGFRFSYHDLTTIRPFVSESGKIVPRRISGLTAVQQRQLTLEIKRARALALLPFTVG
jgi:small subunit ribosomal protein S18